MTKYDLSVMERMRNRSDRWTLLVDVCSQDEVDRLMSVIRYCAENEKGIFLGITFCQQKPIVGHVNEA